MHLKRNCIIKGSETLSNACHRFLLYFSYQPEVNAKIKALLGWRTYEISQPDAVSHWCCVGEIIGLWPFAEFYSNSFKSHVLRMRLSMSLHGLICRFSVFPFHWHRISKYDATHKRRHIYGWNAEFVVRRQNFRLCANFWKWLTVSCTRQ